MTDGDETRHSRQSRTMRHFSRRESGQAAVETAIVMPLFVFIILGILQLGLVHQARIMTKYAAYKAVRAGALRGADETVMKNAAIAVLLPILTNGQDSNGGQQPIYKVYNVSSADKYRDAYSEAQPNNPPWGKLVDVAICSPTGTKATGDFDKPDTNPDGWETWDHTKLAIQVTTYMPLYIPYANAFVWWAARGEDAQVAQTMATLRMSSSGAANDFVRNKKSTNNYSNVKHITDFETNAQSGTYILPVRASYAMRMQSQFTNDAKIPGSRQTTDCVISWEKQ